MNTFIRRGDIYYCYFGNNSDLLSERKPVLVIQSDEVNAKSSTAIVAAIIVGAEKRHLPTHVMLPEGVAFKSKSMVMLEQLRTVDKTELTDRIGTIEDESLWKEINKAVKKTLGLWIYRKERVGNVRCLCPSCLNDYKQVNGIIIKRFDPFQSSKSTCDKCNGLGYDYIIYDKKRSSN